MADSLVLLDVLQSDLAVVFCGTAAGKASEAARQYYAHPNNLFWTVLHETGLTPSKLKAEEFRDLPKFRIGLTDLIKDDSGNDDQIRSVTIHDKGALELKIKTHRPLFVAFTSKRAGQLFFGGKIALGEQKRKVGDVRAFVLPSTSLSARWQWKETMQFWHEFAALVRASA